MSKFKFIHFRSKILINYYKCYLKFILKLFNLIINLLIFYLKYKK